MVAGSCRLPARQVHLKSPDFSIALSKGKAVRGRGVTMIFRNNHVALARLGLIVPKRALPSAVDRNRLKRVLREWFRANNETMLGMDCVVRITSSVIGGRMEQALLAELQRLMSVRRGFQ